MNYILKLDTLYKKDIVCSVNALLSTYKLDVLWHKDFVDCESNRFFMRIVFTGRFDKEKLEKGIKKIAKDSNLVINEVKEKKVVVLVTKESHCLGDLLIRYDSDELNANILAVIGNHDNLKPLTERFNILFHHVSHEDVERKKHEQEIIKLIDNYDPDYIVLAKYLRILSPEFVKKYNNRIINIHHSFLPAFVGANPYKQAYDRGVKIIGATAHFVTSDLDQGPIITQQVKAIKQTCIVKDIRDMGKDVEKIALANALKLVFEDKVFINKNKTVILD